MSSSCSREADDRRGQTEPLAALIAISTIALAIGIYGGYLTDVVGSDTERDVSEPTLTGVWDAVGEDGVYTKGELGTTNVPASQYPKGYNVYVNVTVLADDGWEQVEETGYNATGAPRAASVDPGDIGDHKNVASRPIPYRNSSGEVRSARMYVVVWTG